MGRNRIAFQASRIEAEKTIFQQSMKLPAVNCRVSSGIAPKPTRLRSMSYGAVASPFIPAASYRVFWRRRIKVK